MIRVLVVDDSPVVRDLISYILESDPQIKVIATATNGLEAIEVAAAKEPDVITMDIFMPVLDGVEAVRRIMETAPVPTLIISASINPGESGNTFRALEAGALAVCEKPRGPSHPDYKSQAKKIVQTVKLIAQVAVIRRRRLPSGMIIRSVGDGPTRIELLAIGASTGGPQVLCTILSGLKADYPVPILIVQHIAPGFLPGLVEWLSSVSGLHVEIAADGQATLPGRAYIAPDGAHMEARRSGFLRLRKGALVNGMRPAVSVLFRSVAEEFGGAAIGVLLTGMGRDGADELLLMKKRGAITIAQDKESSVVYGMPGEANKLRAARYVLPPDLIVEVLNTRTWAKE